MLGIRQQTLIVTVNGGKATTAPARLAVGNLAPGRAYRVERDGQLYDGWRREGDRLVITTQPLSAVEESYAVRPDSGGGCSCETAGHASPAIGLALLALLLAWRCSR